MIKESGGSFDNLDLLKTLGMVFVIAYHFKFLNFNLNTIRGGSTYVLTSILSTCVPLFFFVNGFLLLKRETFNLKDHYKKLFRMVIVTVVWSFLTCLFCNYIYNSGDTMQELILGTIKLRDGWNNHIWFMFSLTFLYMFYPILHLGFKYSQPIFLALFATFFISNFGNIFFNNLATIRFFIIGESKIFSNTDFFLGLNPLVKTNPFFAFSYFMAGGLLFYYKDKLNNMFSKSKSIGLLFISILLLGVVGLVYSKQLNGEFDIIFYGYSSIFTFTGVIALFLICRDYRSKGLFGKLIKAISENSLGIYFLHVFGCRFLEPYLKESEIGDDILFWIVSSILLLFASLGMVLILKKIPIIKELFKM